MVIVSLILSGCMYPEEQRIASAPPHEHQIQQVQDSIQAYQMETGVLPIHTRDADTPIYHKYVVNFNLLMQKNFIERPPAHSFEGGGIYQYVLINVEEEPEVRLIDVRLSRQVRDVQRRVNVYWRNNDILPIDELIDGGFFTIDYRKINLRTPPTVDSPYSKQPLPLIVDQRGQVGIDYRIDLYQIMQQMDDLSELQEGEDIRFLLTENSEFAPAHSFPYTIKDGEPVFINRWEY